MARLLIQRGISRREFIPQTPHSRLAPSHCPTNTPAQTQSHSPGMRHKHTHGLTPCHLLFIGPQCSEARYFRLVTQGSLNLVVEIVGLLHSEETNHMRNARDLGIKVGAHCSYHPTAGYHSQRTDEGCLIHCRETVLRRTTRWYIYQRVEEKNL